MELQKCGPDFNLPVVKYHCQYANLFQLTVAYTDGHMGQCYLWHKDQAKIEAHREVTGDTELKAIFLESFNMSCSAQDYTLAEMC